MSFVKVQVEVAIPWEEWGEALAAAKEVVESIPEAAAQMRDHLGVSRSAFVEDIDITESRYASIELGTHFPTIEEATIIFVRTHEVYAASQAGKPVSVDPADPPTETPEPEPALADVTDLPV